MMSDKRTIEIRTGTVIRFFVIAALLWLLYIVREVVAVFFLSIIFTATLDPAIDRLYRKGVPRALSVLLLYVAFFMILGTAISLLMPPLVSQFKEFIENMPSYSEKISTSLHGIEVYAESYGISINFQDFFKNASGGVVQSSGQIFSTTASVLHLFISIIAVLSLTFYMSVKENGMKKFMISLVPKGKREYVLSLVQRIQNKVGRWMFGQILLMIIIFILDFIALSIFNVPYALVLALIAGLLEIVPYLGPIISATLAAIFGFLVSPLTGITVLCVLTIIQQLESHVIVPQIMRKAVGLNPVVVILALLIGAKLGGTIGAILSVPIATALGVFIEDIANGNRPSDREVSAN